LFLGELPCIHGELSPSIIEEIDSEDIFNALERIAIGLEKKAGMNPESPRKTPWEFSCGFNDDGISLVET